MFTRDDVLKHMSLLHPVLQDTVALNVQFQRCRQALQRHGGGVDAAGMCAMYLLIQYTKQELDVFYQPQNLEFLIPLYTYMVHLWTDGDQCPLRCTPRRFARALDMNRPDQYRFEQLILLLAVRFSHEILQTFTNNTALAAVADSVIV